MHTVSETIAGIVADHTTEVFALMGNGNAYFTDALARQDRVRLTAVRHEAATVASADAYQRITRRTAVATTTYGPGYTNALTPLAEAVCSRTPLVFVVGGEPTTGRRPWDVDQVQLAQSVGARTLTVDADSPRAITRQAFSIAGSEHVPVVLFIPYDLASAPAADEVASSPVHQETTGWPVDSSQLEAFAGLLQGAQRPLILAGRGASMAATQLGALAERIGAITTTTAPARGTFAGQNYDVGVCGGFASETSSELIRQADVVLAVGAGLNQFTTAFGTQFSPDCTLLQIDVLPEATNQRVDRYFRSEAVEAVHALLEHLPEPQDLPVRWAGLAEHARSSRLNFDRDPGTGQAPDGLLDPRTAMVRLNEILPANRQVVSDGGHFIGWSSYYFDLPAPDCLTMVGTQYQSIGLGLPSAPGAAIARPEATIVVATGDGGGVMGLPDLDSLVRTASSAVVLVFNDGCYGAEIHQYGSQGLDEAIMEIDQLDFAKLAEGFGAKGLVVKTMQDIEEVQQWVSAGAQGTLVLDLRISRSIVAPYILEIIELTLKK